MKKKNLKKINTNQFNIFFTPNNNIKRKELYLLEELYTTVDRKGFYFLNHQNSFQKSKEIIDILAKSNPSIFENTFFCQKGSDSQGWNISHHIDGVNETSNQIFEYLIQKKLLTPEGYTDLDQKQTNFDKIFDLTGLPEIKKLIIKDIKKIPDDIYHRLSINGTSYNETSFSKILNILDNKKPFSSISTKEQQEFFAYFYAQDWYLYKHVTKTIESRNQNIFQNVNLNNDTFLSHYFFTIAQNREIIDHNTILSFLEKTDQNFLFQKYNDIATYKPQINKTIGLLDLASTYPKIFEELIEQETIKKNIKNNANFINTKIKSENNFYLTPSIKQTLKTITEYQMLDTHNTQKSKPKIL